LKLQESLVKSYVDKFISEIGQRSRREESIDISRWFNFATFDVIGDLAFGEPFDLLISGELNRYVYSIFGSVKIGIFIQAVTQLFVSPFTEIFMLLFVPKKLIEDLKYQVRLAEEKLKSRMQITEPRNDFCEYAVCFLSSFLPCVNAHLMNYSSLSYTQGFAGSGGRGRLDIK
jgi:hypothetical protein